MNRSAPEKPSRQRRVPRHQVRALLLESVSPANGQKPAIKSVSFDLSSGIKTIRMMDGTVHEEPIDSSAMSKLGSEPAGASLTSFVDQVRKAPRPQ